MEKNMVDDIKDKLGSWTGVVVDVAKDTTAKVAEVATETVKAIGDAYQGSGLEETVTNASAVAKTASDKTGEVLDTVSGQKILEHMEKRNVLQNKYNDILATKLEEAFRRIEVLEKRFAKVAS
jgi:hypothetical protein